MLRGNGGQEILKDDGDRAKFCLLLQYACEKHQLNVHGFCFMRNHVHLIIQPHTSNLTNGMHAVGFRYAQYFNKKYKRRGYLYQGRYKAVLVQSGTYLRRLIRYIHLNPVRAGIVQQPEDYRWSSHRAYIGKAEYSWLNRILILDAFSDEFKGSLEQLSSYVQMNDDEARNEVAEIQKSLRKGAYGDSEFLGKWCPILNEDKGLDNFQFNDTYKINVQNIVDAVCRHFNITLEDVCSAKRTKYLVLARMVMANLTKRLGAGSMTELAKQISRDPTSLAKLARKGELDVQVQNFTKTLLTSLTSEKYLSYA